MTLYRNKYRVESIRLPNYDYGKNGAYFVTICTHDRQHFFGEIRSAKMHLSPMGAIAQQFWMEIPQHFSYVFLDAYVIMPDHVHGIIVIDRPHDGDVARSDGHAARPDGDVGRPGRDVACNVSTGSDYTDDISIAMSAISPSPGSLGAIVRSYKSAVTRWCKQNEYPSFAWQPRFYERIIRADGSIDRIRQYIINNPSKWKVNKKSSACLWM